MPRTFPRPDLLVRSDSEVGEGPVWIPDGGILSWVDITAGLWHRTLLDSGTDQVASFGTMLGAIAPATDGGWVAAVTEGFAIVSADGGFEVAVPELPEPSLRMNDAKCDSRGRLWAGSDTFDFAPGRGRLHCLDAEWNTAVHVDGLTLPNGLGWSPDDTTFYLVDTVDRVLLAFDFDLDDGALSNRRILVSWESPQAIPDGLTVDVDGCVWVARWDAGTIERFSPTGELIGVVPCPVTQPSSCAFTAGSTLVITSARQGIADPHATDPLAGSVFAVDVGVAGAPVAAFSGSTGGDRA